MPEIPPHNSVVGVAELKTKREGQKNSEKLIRKQIIKKAKRKWRNPPPLAVGGNEESRSGEVRSSEEAIRQ